MATGNGTEAAIQAYDTDSRSVAKVISSQNLTKPNVVAAVEAKKQELMAKLEDETMKSLLCAIDIRDNENNPAAVRLKAAQDLLDRAGFAPSKNFTISGQEPIVLETRHTQEIAMRARELMAERLKDEHEESQE